LATTRKQEDVIPTILTGFALNNRLVKIGNGEVTVQLELNILLQNIVPVTNDMSNDGIQFFGFSPGIIFNYLISAGESKTGYPFKKRYVNLHFGIRPLIIDHAAAAGTMFEAGISWRTRIFFDPVN